MLKIEIALAFATLSSVVFTATFTSKTIPKEWIIWGRVFGIVGLVASLPGLIEAVNLLGGYTSGMSSAMLNVFEGFTSSKFAYYVLYFLVCLMIAAPFAVGFLSGNDFLGHVILIIGIMVALEFAPLLLSAMGWTQ